MQILFGDKVNKPERVINFLCTGIHFQTLDYHEWSGLYHT